MGGGPRRPGALWRIAEHSRPARPRLPTLGLAGGPFRGEQAPQARLVQAHAQGAAAGEAHQAGLGAPRLVDLLAARHVHVGASGPAQGGEVHGQVGGVQHVLLGGLLAPLQAQHHVAAGGVRGVQPQVVAARALEGELVVVARRAPDPDLAPALGLEALVGQPRRGRRAALGRGLGRVQQPALQALGLQGVGGLGAAALQQALQGGAALLGQLALLLQGVLGALELLDALEQALIWYGRRTAYLGRYRDAVAIYSGGLKLHPGSPELYRHRGHRYITLRKFDEAVWDLEQAARLIEGKADVVEQDGLPNARNQPTSTLHSNIWYHLGLAYFVQADYESAKRCYLECRKVSRNPDMLCATTHWLYMTLRRLGEDDEARATLEPIRAEMDVIENTAYHRLLLMYKGEIDPDRLLAEVRGDNGTIETASTGFGVANWLLVEGDRDSANALMEDLASGAQWAAFGSIAAEADVARRRATP